MTSIQPALLVLLGIVMILNAVLIVQAIRTMMRGPDVEPRLAPALPASTTTATGPPTLPILPPGRGDERNRPMDPDRGPIEPTVEAIEAFVAGVAVGGASTPPSVRPLRLPAAPSAVPDREEWLAAVRDEADRVARFGRPATVVVVDIDGIARLSDGVGPDAAARADERAATFLASLGRAVDRFGRLDDGRYAILLPETDARAAGGVVDRLVRMLTTWLPSIGLAPTVRIASSTSADAGDLASALDDALERLARPRSGVTPIAAGARAGRRT